MRRRCAGIQRRTSGRCQRTVGSGSGCGRSTRVFRWRRARLTRTTVKDSRVVEQFTEVPGGCCGLLSGSVNIVRAVEDYDRDVVWRCRLTR
jgi:hypothetical protein